MTKQDQELMNEQKPTSYTRVPVSNFFFVLMLTNNPNH